MDVMWLKLSDFESDIDKTYMSLMKYFPITFSNVEWKVKHGEWINIGDTLFIAKSRMLPFGDLSFTTKKEGFVVFEKQQYHSMTIKCSEKLVGISAVRPNWKQKVWVSSGTSDFYDKYIITAPKHKGVEYVKVPILNSTKYFIHPNLKINKFLFRIIDWLCSEDRSFIVADMADLSDEKLPHVFINKDYTIDICGDYTYIEVKNDGRLPDFIKFNEVEGNFSIDFYPIALNVVTNLKGCPTKVSGDFDCQGNSLTSFDGSPRYIGGNFVAKTNKISSFVGMPEYIGGCFNISNNELDDASWEYAKENIKGEFGDYNISNNKFIKYRKGLY